MPFTRVPLSQVTGHNTAMPGTGSYYCNIGLVKALCSSDHKHNDIPAVCLSEIEFEILKNLQGYHTVPASF